MGFGVKRICMVLGVMFFSISISAQDDETTDTSGVNVFIEKVMDVITIERAKYSVTFFPTMTYSDEAGLALGAFAAIILNENEPVSKSKYYRPTTLVPSISYSTKGFLLIESDLLRYTKSNWFIGSKFIIYKMPQFFYGIGEPNQGIAKFDQDTYAVFGTFLKSINDSFFIGPSYDIGYVKNTNVVGDQLNSSITGYEGGVHAGLGLAARIDTRDDILYPSKGVLVSISSMQYTFDYNFNLTKFDFRIFRKIRNNKNIVAFQALWQMNSGDAPFYKLPKLGGQNLLRSIDNSNKYINKQTYLLQGEYRRGFGGRFGAVVFSGFGNSLSGWDDPYFDDVVYMYGLGFRFRLLKNDKLNFRFDYGMGNGAPAIFMTIREAF